MTRLAAIVFALLACGVCVGLALLGAGQMERWAVAHPIPYWFAPSCAAFTSICVAIAAWQRKKNQRQGEPMTPLVRRDPRTGLRLF